MDIDALTLLVKYGLVDRNNGTIFDIRSNLLWQQVSSDKLLTWPDAKQYCKKLRLAGHKDWKLPTINELKSLIRHPMPAICPIFKYKVGWYWSSTTYVIGCYYCINPYTATVCAERMDNCTNYVLAVCNE